ncbi:hypothetical protein BXZ70DRAFT_1015382 [Cristinia sonorae]|uniref:Mediator of RNA polymerase II transcription subunit 12 n=1 Tax=Cristinia sonorae TaxID=1940300 RepID=A0A8K0V0P1_9AGAR|nr:hypothetical protein BXZ70DRAFT_1015382 [Cristinia sonorae]
MAGAGEDNLPIYETRPPPWLPKTHHSADLGFIGFYPPHPDQEEDILSETNVKNGLIVGLAVPAENFSANENITPRIQLDEVITDLEEVMNQIFLRRREDVPPVPTWTFRLPSRVTLNEAKRQAWFNDLANPEVPLGKLGKSVPHGAKGYDLLELLCLNNVAIPRAVWFLRVFGGNETAGLRNKPAYNPTQYSVEWANVVSGYLKKQLVDIALPIAPRPGLNIKQTFKGVLSEEVSRKRWISRFTYSLKLLRSFYAEGLVDNRTFLSWLVQQMGLSNLAQLGFIAHLSDEYLDGMLATRALTRPFVEACANRILEIRTTPSKEQLSNLERLLTNLLLRAFLALPSAFISPRSWTQHSALLKGVVTDYTRNGPLAPHTAVNPQALRQALLMNLEDIKERNEAMLFLNVPPRTLGSRTSVLGDIQLLNSLSGTSDIGSIVYFDQGFEESPTFTRKLDVLLTWSVTTLQYGDHRTYAASSLLRCWRDRAEERAIRRDKASPEEFIQDKLFDWLDSCEVAAKPESLQTVASLFSQLVRHSLFSYEQYIQRLIARGEPGLSFSEEPPSRHRNFLRWIPLQKSSVALINHRKVTLYGVRARETPEDVNEREIRKEIRSLLPELFGGEPLPLESFTDGLEGSCSLMYSAPLYEQLRVVRGWLMPILKKAIVSHGEDDESIDKIYCVATALMAHCRAYVSMLDWTLFILEHANSAKLFTAVIETIKQHTEVWACMDATKIITFSLHNKHMALKAQGNQNSSILDILIEMDQARYLEQEARETVLMDRSAYTNALRPAAVQTDHVPAALPEILLLATNPSPDAPSMLANSLWYRYRSAPDWGWKVWDNTLASLRQIPSMISDTQGRRVCALRYAVFLSHVDHHLPNGIDGHICNWLLGAGKSEMAALNAEAWDVTIVVLLQLTISGALSATSLLEGLIYPSWHMASTVASAQEGTSVETHLNAVSDLCCRLLLKKECGGDFPPFNLLEARGLRTRRRDVFRPPHFTRMVDNIPTLVLAEVSTFLPLAVKEKFHALRKALCQVNVFRQGIYRDLDVVHRAFGKFLDNQSTSETLQELLLNALRIMLNDGSNTPEDVAKWHQLSTLLSPWKLAATSIEMRFSMKQLDTALAGVATRERANAYLDKVTKTAFYQLMSPEEGDLLAEMLRGASIAIASKFVNAGLQRIAEIITDISILETDNQVVPIAPASDLLRLLTNIVKPLRDEGAAMPSLHDRVQNELFAGLCLRLTAIAESVAVGIHVEDAARTTVLLARIIHFALGFQGVWTDEVITLSGKLCTVLVRLAMLFGSGITGDPLMFPLLLDTLYYVLDEIPTDPKTLSYDPFRHYPDFELQALPPDLPTEYRKQMRTLLPYTDPIAAVANLAYASHDASGSVTSLVAMQNRPWEWTENLGDIAVVEDKDGSDRSKVKNTASLSLDIFGAQTTGESMLQQEEIVDPRVVNTIRTFEDHLFGESVFHRDWRDSRIPPDDYLPRSPTERAEQEDQVGPLPTFPAPAQASSRHASSRGSRRPSPASSVRSRSSLHAFNAPSVGSSLRPSPMHPLPSGSTAGDPIDVDSIAAGSSTGRPPKRAMDIDDLGNSHGTKRSKVKTTSTSKTKKR